LFSFFISFHKTLGVRELRNQISRKVYERREIANTQLSEESVVPFNVFKDTCLLDTLDLKDNYLEADLEKLSSQSLKSLYLNSVMALPLSNAKNE